MTVDTRGPTGELINQTCMNCAHKCCMFAGEDGLPVYRGYQSAGAYCWIDPNSEHGVRLMGISRALLARQETKP